MTLEKCNHANLQSIDTRWDSTLDMLERYLLLLKYIEVLSIDDRKLATKLVKLTLHTNTILERATKLLKPFKNATKLVDFLQFAIFFP